MIDKAQIEAAYGHISSYIRKTPVIEVDGDDFGVATPLLLKLELLQHSSSFKPRGAFMNLLTRDVPEAGVAAASGGNHGAAVAYAAMRLGIPAKIYVPTVSPKAKVQRIKDYGADVVVTGARYADALAECEAWIEETGALSVHAYDQTETLIGQGTTGLEFEAQAPDLDTVLVSVGGGGFIGGIAAWYGGRTKVVGVEPETSRALHAALEAGKPVDVEVEGVAADSLGARSVGRPDVSDRTRPMWSVWFWCGTMISASRSPLSGTRCGWWRSRAARRRWRRSCPVPMSLQKVSGSVCLYAAATPMQCGLTDKGQNKMELLLALVVASAFLVLLPGPNVAFIVATSIGRGNPIGPVRGGRNQRRAGIATGVYRVRAGGPRGGSGRYSDLAQMGRCRLSHLSRGSGPGTRTCG